MENGIRISSAAISDRGLSEKRPENEDSYLEIGPSGIFAVADGVGGAQAGEVASQMAMEILGEAFTNFHTGSNADEVMRTAIERANSAIYQMAQELPQLANMATTIVALHLSGNTATIGHVGDSRLYSVDREGNLVRETEDHSMVAEEVRAGRMTEEQAENHPSRNIISRALGAEATVDVEIKTIVVDPGTSFLICSDGITRHVGDQEIKGVLTFGGDPVDICEYLKGLCYERGAEDNLTALVVKVSGSPDEAFETPAEFGMVDEDEPTVAAARSPFENKVAEIEDDELLELDTHELKMPQEPHTEPEEEDSDTDTIPVFHEVLTEETEPDPEHETVEITEPEPPQVAQVDSFSMFGDAGAADDNQERSGSVGKILISALMLILGTAIGLGIYHFGLVAKPVTVNSPQLSEMKAATIPLTAFEENRRSVDKDPADYVAKFGAAPQDCEDFYLLGRAYLLLGDYVNAKISLTEAQNRLASADPVNAKILASDIAMGLAITNNTTIQTMFKKELDSSAKTNSNVNSNTNTNR